jgi:hypothetical protein
MKRLLSEISESSSGVKIATAAVVGVWSLVVLALVVVLVLFVEQPGQAQPPQAPVAGVPTIGVEPPAASAGSTLAVRGSGWTPGGLVLIYLAAPGQAEPPSYAAASVAADTQGSFSITLMLPADPNWQTQGLARVIARSAVDGASAEASFSLVGPQSGATDTPAAPPTETASPEPSATPTATASPTPTPSPEPGVPAGSATTDLNVRGGPGTAYPVLGALRNGQSAEITGISPDRAWWQIRFSGAADGRGGVAARYVNAVNTGNVPVVQPPALPPTPTPTPTATPILIYDWRGEYFNNPSLAGAPALVRNDVAVGFDWGSGSPAPGLPVDNFSARWTRSLDFDAGAYRFYARVDDGVRLWIDNNLVIDQWHDSALTTYSADVNLSQGTHTVRMEYYERAGGALAQLAWEYRQNFPDWKAEYFDNRDLRGGPVVVRNETRIDNDWGRGSPASSVPSDNFSARYTREMELPAGTYRFTARVDDGVRLWVDDRLVLDSWQNGSEREVSGDIRLDAGEHTAATPKIAMAASSPTPGTSATAAPAAAGR